MIKVHHLNNSRSQRILWLLEELGTPYEIVPYQRDAVTNLAPPELKGVHPLGKSPVIEDGGLKLAESGAIVDYLIRDLRRRAFSAGARNAGARNLPRMAALCRRVGHAAVDGPALRHAPRRGLARHSRTGSIPRTTTISAM